MPRARPDIQVVASRARYLLVDPYGVRPTIVMSPGEYAIYHALAADRSTAQIRRLARSLGMEVTADEISGFEAQLVQEHLFEGHAAQRHRDEARERSFIGDTLVVSGTADTAAICRSLLDQARITVASELGPQPAGVRIEGILSPHGNHDTTGPIAARAYALLAGNAWPDVFVIVATSHYGGRPAILMRDVHTPVGVATCHRELAEQLQVQFDLEPDAPEFVADHSWRQDLPLLQTAARDAGRELRIVAILIADLDEARARALGRAVRDLSFDRLEQACLIASGDLSHYEPAYPWHPRWLAKPRSVTEVVAAVQEFERPILASIVERDDRAFSRRVGPTSFCARAQVCALMEHVTVDGRLLAHASVVNWKPYRRARRRWRDSDVMFDAAAIVFGRGLDARAATPRLCSNIVLRPRGDELVLIHRCDLTSRAVPAAAAPLLDVLWRGGDVARVARTLGIETDDIAAFVAELRAAGLVHAPEPPTTHHSRLVAARAPRGLATATFQTSDDLRRVTSPPPSGRRFVSRHSSASSGRTPVQTVVEKTVRRDRVLAEVLVQPAAMMARTAHVNRPANLSLREPPSGWPSAHRRRDDLRITPGPDPSRVSPDVWLRVLEQLVRFDPEQLEGDPAYLAGLAHACLASGVRLPRVSAVFVGHGHAWQLYRDPMRAAFGCRPIVRYHSSELGEIAIACRLGALHLLEINTLFEVIAGGVPAGLGQLGELVATTLDTKVRPLLRYATGDVVRLVDTGCRCGKPFRTIEIAGRVTDLIMARRRPVTYPELDAAIGSPMGVRFFQLSVGRRTAVLELAPKLAREVCPTAALREEIARLLDRGVTVRFVDGLSVPDRGKLLALRGVDQTELWRSQFLGRAPPPGRQ